MNSNRDINQLYTCISYISLYNYNLNSLVILYKAGAQCKSLLTSIYYIIYAITRSLDIYKCDVLL